MSEERIIVSVIIPCFNQGQYIDDAVDSVLSQTFQDFEIVIVNDGSTDDFTNIKLENYNKPKTKVINTSNRGLSSARNKGIQESTGDYILPLDADDKIGSRYLEKAVEILKMHNDIGIVYCKAEFFGDRLGSWDLPAFSKEAILLTNMIFCSALFRRSDFMATKGYNCNMIYGWEDWDLWLSIIETGKGVYKLPDVHFYYRIKNSDSMVRSLGLSQERKSYSLKTLYFNHFDYYVEKLGNPIQLYAQLIETRTSLKTLLQSKEYRIGRLFFIPVRLIKRLLKVTHSKRIYI